LEKTLRMGQAFRWLKTENGRYRGVIYDKMYDLKQCEGIIEYTAYKNMKIYSGSDTHDQLYDYLGKILLTKSKVSGISFNLIVHCMSG